MEPSKDESEISLVGAPDLEPEQSSTDPKVMQCMQIELARDTVRQMQKASKLGRPIAIGFGKHIVCNVVLTLDTLLLKLTYFTVLEDWQFKDSPQGQGSFAQARSILREI